MRAESIISQGLRAVRVGSRTFDYGALCHLQASHDAPAAARRSIDALAIWLATECRDAMLIEVCEVAECPQMSAAALLASLVPAPARVHAMIREASESLAAPRRHPATLVHVRGCLACQQNARAVAAQDRA